MSGLLSHVIERSVMVEATPWNIWKVLADFDSYGRWNALYPQAAGTLVTGGEVRASMRLFRDVPSAVTLRVVAAEHSKELVWTCSYAFPGFLDIMHCVIIAPVDRHGSRFTHGLRVHGLLTPLFGKALRTVATANMDRFTAALKAEAQARRQ